MKTSADLGKDPVSSLVLRLAIPAMIAQFVNVLYSIIDRMSPFLILATDSILLIVMNTVLQKYGGPEQGDMLITCATIVQSYMLLITSPMIGISGGTQAIISYNYGARQTQRVKKTVRTNLKLMLLFTTFMFILSRFIPGTFVRLFTSSQEYMDFSVWGIKVFTMMIIPLSFQYVFVDALTALERTKTALFLIYSVSSFTTSSKSVISLLPLTCHIPVIPGFMAILAL